MGRLSGDSRRIMNPDQMRANPNCVDFAQQFPEEGKPVAAICHGQQLLIV